MSEPTSSRLLWGWLVAGAAVSVVVFFLVFSQSGSCAGYVSPDAESSCVSEPIVGSAGAWAIGLAGVVFVIYALYRAFRRRH